ncbi:hypothetical protein BT93_F1569 [Corymbia citriodora subsp. variegata]|nr:hypothetical protein BT93_F1569 [Corymbia citriodora subsp. variegata]KAF8024427.1 hypothetical protein BT93_F1569 [Corymbia citriodora subsp. variegata]KAF8024428.1 hypothetical protein BT93_F1569 [Corymbia citriodora subsp. variegata]
MVSVIWTFSPCISTNCTRKCSTSKCSILLGYYASSCTRKMEDIAVSSYQPRHYHGRLSLQSCKPIFPRGHSSFFSATVCQAKQGDSAFSGENIALDQQILEQELQVAIKEENYAKAAKLRDTLRSIQEDSKASVLAANAEFYRSFKNGDLSAMQAIWSKGDHVCCVHPGALGISGYESVMDSWIHVWGNYEFPLEIELREVRVHVRGNLGYVTCVELVKTKGSSWGGQFVTNVFERSDGQWFICVHHASPVDF